MCQIAVEVVLDDRAEMVFCRSHERRSDYCGELVAGGLVMSGGEKNRGHHGAELLASPVAEHVLDDGFSATLGRCVPCGAGRRGPLLNVSSSDETLLAVPTPRSRCFRPFCRRCPPASAHRKVRSRR